MASSTRSPATINLGSGSDVLSLNISEDYWLADAQFVVKVDGVQVGGVQTTTARHDAGQTQLFNVHGTFGAGSHAATVTFLNDAYNGTAATDRNLFVGGAAVNGAAVAGSSLAFSSNGTAGFTFAKPAAPASNTLHLKIAEDAWQGDTQYSVTVDGATVGGVRTATASHAAGQVQDVAIAGNWGAGPHTIGVNFLNDAYGGTATTDRNLYVEGVTYDGVPVPGASLLLASSGTQTVTTATAATAAQPAYVVATNGSDAGDGSAAHPFATLQRAALAMRSSTVKTTQIVGGTYTAPLTLGASDSGESFVAQTAGDVTLRGGAQLVSLNGANNVTLSGLTFTGTTDFAVVLNGASNNIITNSTFARDFGGVEVENNSNNNAITNNKMTNTSFAGVEAHDGANGTVIDSNLFDGVGPVSSNTFGGAVYLHGTTNTQITHNQVQNTAGAGISLADFYRPGRNRHAKPAYDDRREQSQQCQSHGVR